jgi:hypothetical protein
VEFHNRTNSFTILLDNSDWSDDKEEISG